MTEQERVMELMADVLQEAQNGLEWYRQEHPNDLSDVDFEIDRRINKALAEYRKLKVKPDPLSGTPDGLVG